MITDPRPMALSIRQPWAWLIVNGYKDIENRGWPTNYRGRVLIHTGQEHDRELIQPEASFVTLPELSVPRVKKGKTRYVVDWLWPHIPCPESFQYGGIIGEATITGCVTSSPSPWFSGEFGFTLTGAKPLPFTPYRGRLGFFPVELPL